MSLKNCLNGEPFFWKEYPAEVYSYRDETLYRYNQIFKEWVSICGPDDTCKRVGCPIHEEVRGKIYYNCSDLKKHLSYVYEMNKTREIKIKGDI